MSDAAEVTYVGERTANGELRVYVAGDCERRELDPRFDLANHSPLGFEWGLRRSRPVAARARDLGRPAKEFAEVRIGQLELELES